MIKTLNNLKKLHFQVGTENGEAVSQSKAFTQLNGNVGQGKKDQVSSWQWMAKKVKGKEEKRQCMAMYGKKEAKYIGCNTNAVMLLYNIAILTWKYLLFWVCFLIWEILVRPLLCSLHPYCDGSLLASQRSKNAPFWVKNFSNETKNRFSSFFLGVLTHWQCFINQLSSIAKWAVYGWGIIHEKQSVPMVKQEDFV